LGRAPSAHLRDGAALLVERTPPRMRAKAGGRAQPGPGGNRAAVVLALRRGGGRRTFVRRVHGRTPRPPTFAVGLNPMAVSV